MFLRNKKNLIILSSVVAIISLVLGILAAVLKVNNWNVDLNGDIIQAGTIDRGDFKDVYDAMKLLGEADVFKTAYTLHLMASILGWTAFGGSFVLAILTGVAVFLNKNEENVWLYSLVGLMITLSILAIAAFGIYFGISPAVKGAVEDLLA